MTTSVARPVSWSVQRAKRLSAADDARCRALALDLAGRDDDPRHRPAPRQNLADVVQHGAVDRSCDADVCG